MDRVWSPCYYREACYYMFTIYKKIGETPLSALERVRQNKGISESVPMTYAGRLDPLAEGLLLILTGEECKEKEAYTNLSKTYEFEILSGIGTDTYDVLGLVVDTDVDQTITHNAVEAYLEENKKTIIQNYPPYSSKTFKGKQLHQHAREGNLPEMTHEVTLFGYSFLGERKSTGAEILGTILERIALVEGDFRQEDIKEKWRDVLKENKEALFQITRWKIQVSSGFYVRQLVHDISKRLHIPLVTFHINRTAVGEYDTTDTI